MRLAPGEGDISGGVHPFSIRKFDKDNWVDEDLIIQARNILGKRQRVSIAGALSEIERLLPRGSSLLPIFS